MRLRRRHRLGWRVLPPTAPHQTPQGRRRRRLRAQVFARREGGHHHALESTFQPATATTLDRTVVRLWAFPAFDSIGEPVTLEEVPDDQRPTRNLRPHLLFVAQGPMAVIVGREQLIRIDVKSGHAERLRDFSACEEAVVDDDGTVKARVGSGINSSVRLWSRTRTEIPLPRGDTLPAESSQ